MDEIFESLCVGVKVETEGAALCCLAGGVFVALCMSLPLWDCNLAVSLSSDFTLVWQFVPSFVLESLIIEHILCA